MRQISRTLFQCLAITVVLSGCATVVHKPITDEQDNTDKGIRYYNASPYVLVYANAAGGISADVKYLADRHKLMSAKPSQWLSSLDVTMKFSDGVLTQADTTADASIVPKAILSAVKAAATAIVAKANEAGLSVPKPRLFKIVRAQNGDYLLVGGEADQPFQLTK